MDDKTKITRKELEDTIEYHKEQIAIAQTLIDLKGYEKSENTQND